jgi:quinohemoprotein ethanol dehydrogenase
MLVVSLFANWHELPGQRRAEAQVLLGYRRSRKFVERKFQTHRKKLAPTSDSASKTISPLNLSELSSRLCSILLVSLLFFLIDGCGGTSSKKVRESAARTGAKPADVDDARLVNADKDVANWLTYGRTYSEQRFSPLKKIDDHNVQQLHLAWYYDLDTRRGQEATPIVVDGVMYFTSAWSKAYALNAATGALLWSYDPKVPPEWGVNACCDVVNRGVAVWKGKVYFGTLDGRLIALDAGTGKPAWETLTVDQKWRYTITGAPRAVKGKILIGNGGGEMGVRGYVSAYDAETGKRMWRFYTVPGDPSKGFENPAMEKAAKTWTGQWWKAGAGGTVWDAITYDPPLDLVYIGVGNGSPWAEKYRSPGGGDNLFTGSIVALKPDTGEYVWHYQEDPGDEWDYDSDEQIVLADLTISGRTRQVLLHAPKNGFFYVLDRATGELLSAKPYTFVNWASGIDLKTGRPIENPQARYANSGKPALVVPGPGGAHSWQPMSFSPLTGLAYLPIQDAGFLYKLDPKYKWNELAANYGIDIVAAGLPQDAAVKDAILQSVAGRLVAWDPVQQKEAWSVKRPVPWNGGTLATAGNLVFEGTADGHFEAYRADTGEKLWSAPAGTSVMAGPVSYTVNDKQYVAVLAGRGGVLALAAGEVSKPGKVPNIGRILAFELSGKASLPPVQEAVRPALALPPSKASPSTIEKGKGLYQRYCSACHGDVAFSGGVLPDLRYSSALNSEQWIQIVLGGMLKPNGMVSFSKELSRQDAEAVRAYVIFRAHESLQQEGRANQVK